MRISRSGWQPGALFCAKKCKSQTMAMSHKHSRMMAIFFIQLSHKTLCFKDLSDWPKLSSSPNMIIVAGSNPYHHLPNPYHIFCMCAGSNPYHHLAHPHPIFCMCETPSLAYGNSFGNAYHP